MPFLNSQHYQLGEHYFWVNHFEIKVFCITKIKYFNNSTSELRWFILVETLNLKLYKSWMFVWFYRWNEQVEHDDNYGNIHN